MEEDKIKQEVTEIIEKSVSEKTDTIKKDIEKSVEEKTKSVSEDTEKLKTELKDLAETKLKALEDETTALKKDLEEKTETIKEMGKKLNNPQTLKQRKENYVDMIRKAVIENAQQIKDLNGTNQKFKVEKAAETIMAETHLTDPAGIPATDYITEFERGITHIQQRAPFMRELVRTSAIALPFAAWVEEVAGEGDADMTAEGAQKPLTDVKWVERKAETRKISARSKMSEETLDDIEWAATEVANDLAQKVLLKEDEQILKGDGTGINYKGVLEYAPTFNVTVSEFPDFYQQIPGASHMDVLRVAIAMIVNRNFSANTIVLNPIDAALMDLTKDLMQNYIFPPFKTMQGVDVRGLKIIENNGIEPGTFLVGDMTRSNYRIRKELSIEFGRSGEDFEHNLYTVIAELRGVHYIKENERNAFIKGNFTDAIDMIKSA